MTGHKIVIPDEVYQKIMHWVNKANFEVSGFGTVLFDPEAKTFTIEDAFLVKQEGSAAATDINANDLGKAMYMAHKLGLKGTINFWWHSHVKMSVFWSGTDMDTIKDLGKNGYIIATVFNQMEENRSAFAAPINVPFIGPRVEVIDNFETEIIRYLDSDKIKAWDASFDELVTRKTYTSPVHTPYLGKQWDRPYANGNSLIDKAYGAEYYDADMMDAQDRANISTNYNKSALDHEWKPSNPEIIAEYKKEAHLLGIKYKKYIEIINTGTYEQLAALEDRLEVLRLKGKL